MYNNRRKKGVLYMNLEFKDACELFLVHEKRILKFQTYNLTVRNFNLHIIPYFENKKIKDIKINDLLSWYNEIDDQSFCSKFKNSLRTKLVQFYDYLILYHDVNINLAKKLDIFRGRNETKKIKIWKFKECRRFLKATKEDIVYNVFFNFLLISGCRVGEALAIKFENIENNKVTLKLALSKDYINGKPVLQTTKTNDTRIISLDFITMLKIKKLKRYYSTQYKYFENSFYVFGGKEPLSRTTLKRRKDYFCDKAKVTRIRIHDFRHVNASILYAITKNVKLVQEQLGHKSSSTTINTYIHVLESQRKRTTRVLNMIRFILN